MNHWIGIKYVNGEPKGRCGGRRKLHVLIHTSWRQCIIRLIGKSVIYEYKLVASLDTKCIIKSTTKYYTKGDAQLTEEF